VARSLRQARERSLPDHAASIVVEPPDGRPFRCSFFVPSDDGRVALAQPLPTKLGTRIAPGCMQYVEAALAQDLASCRPLEDRIGFSKILADAGLRPTGPLLVSPSDPDKGVGGSCNPLTGAAKASDWGADLFATDPSVLIHEVAHSSARGEADDFGMLVRFADTIEAHGITSLTSGWTRRNRFALTREDGQPRFENAHSQYAGWWFEEAMAEVVQLSLTTHEDDPRYDTPVVFSHDGTTFELPREYGHLVAGWSALLLERQCPGVVEYLYEGARGRVDRPRLRRLIDSRFPGLFGELDANPVDGPMLAAGALAILRRMKLV
jgi:hypothetical protein